MNPEQIPRAEMAQIVEHFKGKPRTDDSIREYCNLNKLEYIPTAGELEDLEYQVEHDAKMVTLYKAILAELQNMEYMPELASGKERKRIAQTNENVRIEITKLFENAGVTFRMIDKVANELGGMTGKTIEQAGTTAFNKAMEVLHSIAKERFGGEFTMAHARDYALELYEKHHAKKEENSNADVASTEVSKPNGDGEPQEENSIGGGQER